jgi:hypothetical protein
VATATPTFVRYDEKPGFLRITWAVFVGYLFAAVVVGLAGLALLLLGVVGSSGTAGADPDGLLGWPYWRTGWWSALANATVNLAIVGIAALCVRKTVADHAGRIVRLHVVLVALLVTGYVPVAAFDGALQLSGLLALLVTALLVRQFGVDGTGSPSPPLVPLPSRRLAVLAATALGGIALVITAAYGFTHPLWFSSAATDATPIEHVGGDQTVAYPYEEGKQVAYTFSLTNESFADATVVGIEAEPARLLHLSGFRSDDDLSARPGLGASPFTVSSRDERWVTLTFRLSGCRALYAPDFVTHVTVRYRLLGTTQTQYVPLVPAPATRCP